MGWFVLYLVGMVVSGFLFLKWDTRGELPVSTWVYISLFWPAPWLVLAMVALYQATLGRVVALQKERQRVVKQREKLMAQAAREAAHHAPEASVELEGAATAREVFDHEVLAVVREKYGKHRVDPFSFLLRHDRDFSKSRPKEKAASPPPPVYTEWDEEALRDTRMTGGGGRMV